MTSNANAAARPKAWIFISSRESTRLHSYQWSWPCAQLSWHWRIWGGFRWWSHSRSYIFLEGFCSSEKQCTRFALILFVWTRPSTQRASPTLPPSPQILWFSLLSWSSPFWSARAFSGRPSFCWLLENSDCSSSESPRITRLICLFWWAVTVRVSDMISQRTFAESNPMKTCPCLADELVASSTRISACGPL